MNKSGIIYLIISFVIIMCTAVFVLVPESSAPEEEITVTVMNTAHVTAGTSPATTTTTVKKTTATKTTALSVTTTEITTISSETEISSVSTNTEPVTTSTEPPETVTEQVSEVIFIDINTAGAEELMKLDGIGEVTAYEIINYRELYGGFDNIEEIMNVSGIGEAKFANIKDYIYVQNPVYHVEEETEEIPEPEPEVVTEEVTEPEITLDDIAPININTAGIEELVFLPNVDEQIAQDIISLREQIHGFSHVYELLYVEKLTQNQVAEMVEFVTVGQ